MTEVNKWSTCNLTKSKYWTMRRLCKKYCQGVLSIGKDSKTIIAKDNALVSPAARIPFYPLTVKRAYGATLID